LIKKQEKKRNKSIYQRTKEGHRGLRSLREKEENVHRKNIGGGELGES